MATSLEKYKKFSLSDFTELYEKYHSDRSSHTKTTFRDGLVITTSLKLSNEILPLKSLY